MATISLCMIVKNEAAVLARCLDSVAGIPDEIILVDTGSTDQTRDIAKAYTPYVYECPWTEDFAAARNASFARATMDYILWLDADDVLLPADRLALLRLKDTLDGSVDVVMLPYHTALDSNGKPTFTYYRERLLRRAMDFHWEGAVHEAITPAGHVQYADIPVTHRKHGPSDPDRNLRIYERLLTEGKPLSPRSQFYYARELSAHARYAEAAEMLEQYLAAGTGWMENQIEACRDLAACYYQLEDPTRALLALLHSLAYDRPRAELCCDIGKHFLDRGHYAPAIFWYTTASTCPRPDVLGGFVLPDCYDYVPYLQLCVCYDRLGDHAQAAAYNELAERAKPGDPIVAQNRAYFAARQGGTV